MVKGGRLCLNCSNFVTLSKLSNVSGPQLSHLSNGNTQIGEREIVTSLSRGRGFASESIW